MGAVNTTYTFQPTDVITSSKMNDIIDQTTMTGSAIDGSTLQVTLAGQLKVNAQGITSNELASESVIQAKIGPNVVGTGPFVRAYRLTDQYINDSTETKLLPSITEFNSGNAFNTSTSIFTVPITGVYLVNIRVGFSTNGVGIASRYVQLYINGASNTRIAQMNPLTFSVMDYSLESGCVMILLNAGMTLEIYAYLDTNGGQAKIAYSEFSAVLLAKV